jgi:chemotaxis protein methyltransferase CheR
VHRFSDALSALFGWNVHDADPVQLERVLRRRAEALGCPPADYVERLAGGGSARDEQAALAEALTITETYFFRHREQFDVLAATVLPDRIRARGTAGQRVLRLLSVGCSSGEEAYTLAMVARQAAPDPSWQVSVLGVDANPAMLRRAGIARYSPWALRETPPVQRRRWFRDVGGAFEVIEDVRADVRFQRHNVADEDPALWQTGQYDAIFCRNLLMYLTAEVTQRLVARMTRSLAPGGGLFLGHTDTLGSDPAGLRPQLTTSTLHYVRRGDGTDRAAPAEPGPAPRSAAANPPPTAGRTDGVAANPPPTAGGTGRVAAKEEPSSAEVRQRAVRLLREERFPEAIALLAAGPRDRAADHLYAVVLLHAGRLDDAAQVCRGLLDTDGLDADAHHLYALCLEGPGDLDAAIAHHRLAAYLDPMFAMPRLRIGLLARRRGDDAVAAAELDRARSQLAAETDERILFFGGGFSRAALSTLCRAELQLCGSRR